MSQLTVDVTTIDLVERVNIFFQFFVSRVRYIAHDRSRASKYILPERAVKSCPIYRALLKMGSIHRLFFLRGFFGRVQSIDHVLRRVRYILRFFRIF